MKIDRHVGFGSRENWSIHTFCDASQNAYATVAFLHCIDEKKTSVQVLGAKSRFAPKKNLAILRLELLACVLGTRLTAFIIKPLNITSVPAYYWTDSLKVLAWIRRND